MSDIGVENVRSDIYQTDKLIWENEEKLKAARRLLDNQPKCCKMFESDSTHMAYNQKIQSRVEELEASIFNAMGHKGCLLKELCILYSERSKAPELI